MVALAVIAIVSSSLFQMFVTTSYVNQDAKLTDLGNMIAVSQSETFKADAKSYDDTTKYYNGNGTLLTIPESGGIPTGAVIKVDSTVIQTDLPVNSSGYFPSFVGTIDLMESLVWYVQISPTNEIYIGPSVTELTHLAFPDGFIIKNNALPIKVIFPSGSETYPRTIYITNKSTVEADFFVTNAQVSDTTILAEQIVLLQHDIHDTGSSSITYVTQTVSINTEYNLELTVSKLIGDVSQFMFTYSAGTFIYH